MNERTRSEHRTAGAVRTIAQRFTYFALVLAAIGLMMLGKIDTVMMERLRLALVDTVAPILDSLSTPTDALSNGVDNIRQWTALHEENVRLRHERERLLKWEAVALRLEAENEALKKLLYLVPDPQARYVAGRVVADTGGTFAHSLLLNAGTADGVSKGNVAVTGEGLVGRVVGVARRTARVLLISDLNSRIPVEVSSARTKAILAGNNTVRPLLIHIERDAQIFVGDRVSTSGDAGAFPPGLPVGRVSAIDGGTIHVMPFVQREQLQYVRVVDYGLKGIIGSEPGSGLGRAGQPPAGQPPADPADPAEKSGGAPQQGPE